MHIYIGRGGGSFVETIDSTDLEAELEPNAELVMVDEFWVIKAISDIKMLSTISVDINDFETTRESAVGWAYEVMVANRQKKNDAKKAKLASKPVDVLPPLDKNQENYNKEETTDKKKEKSPEVV